MITKEYNIKDEDEFKATVVETKRQKDILDILDECLENAKQYGWDYIFEDMSFYIEYKDGKTYEAGSCWEDGVYKKKNIKRIIHENPMDTMVYGDYEVNEFGIVS